ncbi:hypothetical protein [Martelella mediterranea]|uniref:Uncharacterized protein n=1 Tax=Martelella mediterranea TaxID=293089 RepID=A0A4R3NK33_9HYPH|nr:hypothetical protein [Martelella mediterranea]TCT34614.1 hypothetical protein EDC90_10338 [Martelella mediterranea]
MVVPLTVSIMLACHVSHDPAEVVGIKVWVSVAAKEERAFLLDAGMIEKLADDWIVTDRGKAWIERLLATPFPVAKWTFPDD